jgi:hypothetical protein
MMIQPAQSEQASWREFWRSHRSRSERSETSG